MRPPLNQLIQAAEAAESTIRTGATPRSSERERIVRGMQHVIATLREAWAAEQERVKGVQG